MMLLTMICAEIGERLEIIPCNSYQVVNTNENCKYEERTRITNDE